MIPGVFTTIKIRKGIPLFLEEHKNRLISQAKALNIKLSTNLEKKITNFIIENNLIDCALRVEINKNGELIISSRPIPLTIPITLISLPDTRDQNKIYKTTNRVINEQAKKYAIKNNADDAIFVDQNNLIESTIANIFSINKNGDIITPPIDDKGLQGIARKVIMKNLKVLEEEVSENTNKPIILTNSLRVQKATHLNGQKLQDGEALFQKIKAVLETAEHDYLNNEVEDAPRSTIQQSNNNKKIFYKELPWQNSEEVFIKLFSDQASSFWLDSSLTNETTRFSYMGIPESIISYRLQENKTIVVKNGTSKKIKQNIFDYLEKQLKKHNIKSDHLPFPFIGGYVGYFGYELKKLTGAKFAYESPYPDSLWFFTEKTIVFDHKEKKVYLVCLTNKKIKVEKWFEDIERGVTAVRRSDFELSEKERARLRAKRDRGGTDFDSRTPSDKKITFKLDRSHQQYLKDIELCKEYLKKGESYQICLTNQLTANTTLNPLQLYLHLRKTNPAPYAAFIKYNDLAILSSSPEEFLNIDDRDVETKPIKGTIRRGKNKREDKLLIKQLENSKKDWSENAMIVDLLRNDLGKVSEFGSVNVKKLMDIETYQTVHQLVSTVTGKLKNNSSMTDVVKATFPGGSMTGAPKIRAMEILDTLENKARGIYSGSIGFLSLNQKARLNIVIRTIIIQNNHLSIGAGGAILTDSDPQKEYEEMLLKANVLMETVLKMYNPGMNTVFLALGSNVGNKKESLRKALSLLSKKIHNISVAEMYETKPMYYEQQDTFINSALQGETELSPEELLVFVKKIEKEVGRKKTFQNGPREIDIDILFYNDLIFKNDQVQIPHPRIQERPFVLKPLMDLDPKFVHPVLKKNIKEIYEYQTIQNT